MAITVLQERASELNGPATSIALAFSSNVTAGSWLECVVYCDDRTSDVFITDNLNSVPYLKRTYGHDTHDGNHGWVFNYGPSIGGACTVTVTLVNSVSFPSNMVIREISGASGFDSAIAGGGANALYQVHPGTGSNNIFTAAKTPTAAPGLIVGTTINGTTFSNSIGQGTGFTAGPADGTWTGVTPMTLETEYLRYTTTASQQVTATDGTRGTLDWYLTFSSLYIEGTPVAQPVAWMKA